MNREEAHLDQCTQEHISQAISYLDSDEWLQLFHQPDPSGINNLRIAVSTVIDAINQFAADANVARSPWVKTADRLPDKCEYYTMYLTTKKRNGGVWQVRGIFIKEHPELCPWWMPIPPLPEVEE